MDMQYRPYQPTKPSLFPKPQQQNTQQYPVSNYGSPESSFNAYTGMLGQNYNAMTNLLGQLAENQKSYQENWNKYESQFNQVMNDLLAKKNETTGNVFTDFMNQYKKTRESDWGRDTGINARGLFAEAGSQLGDVFGNAGSWLSNLFNRKEAV